MDTEVHNNAEESVLYYIRDVTPSMIFRTSVDFWPRQCADGAFWRKKKSNIFVSLFLCFYEKLLEGSHPVNAELLNFENVFSQHEDFSLQKMPRYHLVSELLNSESILKIIIFWKYSENYYILKVFWKFQYEIKTNPDRFLLDILLSLY